MNFTEEKFKKTQKIFIIVASIIGICSLAMFIPQIRELIIHVREILNGKPLKHEVIQRNLLQGGKSFLAISIILAFLPTVLQQLLKSIHKIDLHDTLDKKQFFKYFFCFLIIFLLGIYSLIRANFNYIDDLGRTHKGYRGWQNFSRYISNILSVFIHTGTYLADISPLPQIIAVIFLSISGILLLRILSDNKQFSIIKVFALIPLGLSPYFLECLSFKFDSPYMALSILVSIIPFIFTPKELVQINDKKDYIEALKLYLPYFYFSVIGILMMLMSYQAASGIYPILVLLIALKNWNKKEPFAFFTIVSIIAYIFALIIFKFFFMIVVDNYVSNKIALFSSLKNLKKYYLLLKGDYKAWWNLLQILIVILFPILTAINSKRNKLLAFFAGLLAISFIIIMAFGLYPLLSAPLWAPRAMYGVGVALACISLIVVDLSKCFVCKIPSITICWVFFVFSFAYGNALAEQKRYTDFRIHLLISELESIPEFSTKEKKKVQLSGNIGLSPVLNNEMKKSAHILKRLVPTTFASGQFWREYYFYNYFSLRNIVSAGKTELNESDMKILRDGMYYTIKGDGESFIIKIK